MKSPRMRFTKLLRAVGVWIVALVAIQGCGDSSGGKLQAEGQPSASPANEPSQAARPAGQQQAAGGAAQAAWPKVFINGKELSRDQILQLLLAYGTVRGGRFWYDPTSGLWGAEGREFSGYVHPGLDLGTLSPRASNGNTKIFVNGRELNTTEALFYQWVFQTPSVPGRYWLDGRTGNMGIEGFPLALGNLVQAIQRAQPQGQQGPGFWSGGVNGPGGMVGASSGNCAIVSTSAGSWSTGC